MRSEFRLISESSADAPEFPSSALISERDLPSGHRICCFVPHCDDVRFIGATLKALSEHNAINIIVMASGHHAVTRDIPVEEKRTIRKKEMEDWAKAMHLDACCLQFFDAEATYDAKTLNSDDQERMNQALLDWNPTLMLIPQSDDVLQPINRCTNQMVFNALRKRIECKSDDVAPLVILEYPTLYAPFISFGKRNLNVVFGDTELSELKHKANKAFRSMDRTFLDVSERCIEAYDATALSEFAFHYNCDCHRSPAVPPVNPRMLRCEHFSASKIRLNESGGSIIVRQEMIRFPLAGEDIGLWSRDESGGPKKGHHAND
jgi:LmbE family N-acetylglucosaminyl deacetylase